MMTLDDPQHRTKVWLEDYLNDSALTKDDDVTLAEYAVMNAYPEYPLVMEYIGAHPVDLLFLIGEATTKPLYNADKTLDGYEENVPITLSAVNKTGITASKLKWKAELELRRLCEEHAFSSCSLRLMDTRREDTQRFGSVVIYQTTFTLTYRRQAK